MASVQDYPSCEQSIFKLGFSENMNGFNSYGPSTSHEYFNSQLNSPILEQLNDGSFNQSLILDQSRVQTMAPHHVQAQQTGSQYSLQPDPQYQQLQSFQQLSQQQQQQSHQLQPQTILLESSTHQLGPYPVNEGQYRDVTIVQHHIESQSSLQQLNDIAAPLDNTFIQPTVEQVPDLHINDGSLPLLNIDTNNLSSDRYQKVRYPGGEPNTMNSQYQRLDGPAAPESTFSLTPESLSFSTNGTWDSTLTVPSTLGDGDGYKRYRVIRGVSSGGSATKPPRINTRAHHHYSPVNLKLVGATLQDLCLPKWSQAELDDKRRIIRIERHQVGSKIFAQFSVLGSATENPKVVLSRPGVDSVEVSCLECYSRQSDDTDEEEEEEGEEGEGGGKGEEGEEEETELPTYSYQQGDFFNKLHRNFYITSVEVIKIVELLIGTEVQDAAERRRERGRIRSNLVPFWSKKPISSKMTNSELESSPVSSAESADFRVELATRIMAYDIRKPRGFDKEVRILKWVKLVPALLRALQSYYVEVPDDFDEEANGTIS